MRNLFLALLLANLAFAAWHNWFAAPDSVVQPAADLPTITLASEVAAENAAADAGGVDELAAAAVEVDEPAADTVDEPGDDAARSGARAPDAEALLGAAAPREQRCVSVGPFRELSQATGAAGALRTGGYEPTQRAGEGDIWVGYWVYIERIPTMERANEILAELRDNGVTDAYVIPGGDTGNLISLGVFSEVARAGGRREEARRLGYEPVISDRTRRGTVYWVDVILSGSESIDFDLLQSPGRILRLEQRSCERAAA